MTTVIRVLPEAVANRIAAGEVVERPASVVKELLENALDAGAQSLVLELEDGGTRLVRLKDDGEGMTAADLELCIQSHATSKISEVDDLFRVASFGFRGEALPSVASVSELSITTRRREDDLGSRIVMKGGEASPVTPVGAPAGTTVEVRNLFFNVPARRKFLRQERTELSHCLEAVTRLLLPEPGIAIRVTHNGRHVQDTGASEDIRSRLRSLFGAGLCGSLITGDRAEGGARIQAFFSPPSVVKGTARYQYFFLNGRFIRDRSVTAAIREAYRGLIMPRDHAVVFLFLEMNPADVDVNVHPTKTEVRFRRGDQVFGLVRRVIRDGLMAEDPARPLVVDPGATRTPARGSDVEMPRGALEKLECELFPQGVPAETASQVGEGEVTPAAPSGACVSRASPVPTPRGEPGAHLQLHSSYILLEGPDGLVILDQHALHERKLFEELLVRFRESEGADQQLLVPEVIDVGSADQALMLDRAEELVRWGIVVETFGGTSVCVRSLPAALSRLAGETVVEEILGVLRSGGRGLPVQRLLEETAANLACRAAVKFNDRLADEEISDLIAWWKAHPELRNCPHGRPVAMSLTLKQLEYQFQRKK